jgi:hypothetical protein
MPPPRTVRTYTDSLPRADLSEVRELRAWLCEQLGAPVPLHNAAALAHVLQAFRFACESTRREHARARELRANAALDREHEARERADEDEF